MHEKFDNVLVLALPLEKGEPQVGSIARPQGRGFPTTPSCGHPSFGRRGANSQISYCQICPTPYEMRIPRSTDLDANGVEESHRFFN